MKHDEHIRVVVVLSVHKLQRDGDQIRILAVEMRPDEDSSMSCIPSWEFDDLNTTLQIEGNEVAGLCSRLVANERIGLEGARSAIVQIIGSRANPADQGLPERDEHDSYNHTDPDANQQQALPPARW